MKSFFVENHDLIVLNCFLFLVNNFCSFVGTMWNLFDLIFTYFEQFFDNLKNRKRYNTGELIEKHTKCTIPMIIFPINLHLLATQLTPKGKFSYHRRE